MGFDSSDGEKDESFDSKQESDSAREDSFDSDFGKEEAVPEAKVKSKRGRKPRAKKQEPNVHDGEKIEPEQPTEKKEETEKSD